MLQTAPGSPPEHLKGVTAIEKDGDRVGVRLGSNAIATGGQVALPNAGLCEHTLRDQAVFLRALLVHDDVPPQPLLCRRPGDARRGRPLLAGMLAEVALRVLLNALVQPGIAKAKAFAVAEQIFFVAVQRRVVLIPRAAPLLLLLVSSDESAPEGRSNAPTPAATPGAPCAARRRGRAPEGASGSAISPELLLDQQ